MFLKNIYRKIFPDYYAELRKVTCGCSSILDVGCGSNSPVQALPREIRREGVDAFVPSIEKSREKGLHDSYHNIDVMDIGSHFAVKSFDCVLASDLIEHLEKNDGIKLIEMMEKIARKKVIIFTPKGFLPQGEYENNPWQLHRSGWEVDEMRGLGYKVIGINGWKPLRGEYAELKFKPRRFWQLVSDISQKYTRDAPEKAFQVLCVKDMVK
ncbi:MAG: class I SAM-dependent methyltransferase [Candidatus Kapaibacterium sp.]